MFSYRHGFHAGNHADVLKHTILVFMLEYLKAKEAPIWFVDTHAGAAPMRSTARLRRRKASSRRASAGCGSAAIRRLRCPGIFARYTI